MKIKDILEQHNKGLAFEFFPPKTDEGEEMLFNRITELNVSHPYYVSVTYGAGGSSRDRTQRIVKRIARECDLTVMAHLAVVGQKKAEIREILRDYRDAGIENIMALRGDTPRGTTIRPEDGDFPHASDLIQFIRQETGDHFSLGIAAFPEMHPDSPDLTSDIRYLGEKFSAGAEFAVSQMFFNNEYFFRLIDEADRHGYHKPILPGIMPVSSYKQLETVNGLSGAEIPTSLRSDLEKYQDDEDAQYRIGLDFVARQCTELMEQGFEFLHFFTLNKSQASMDIIRKIGMGEEKKE